MNEEKIKENLDKIEEKLNNIQKKYGVDAWDKMEIIDLLDDIKEEL